LDRLFTVQLRIRKDYPVMELDDESLFIGRSYGNDLPMIEIQILTPIPAIAEGVLRESILGRAQEAGLVKLEAVDLRRWTHDRYRTVDDAPYGGGPGMVMKIEPIAEALGELPHSTG